MCTYSIVIEDNLAAKAEELLNGQPLQAWIEQQLETLVSKPDVATANESSKRLARVKKRYSHEPDDAQLEAYFKDKPMPSMPEDPSWKDILNANSGKTNKSVEKWL